MKHPNSRILDFRETYRTRKAVEPAQPLPSWVHKTDDELYEGMIHMGEHIFKIIALAIVVIVCAASIWQRFRTQTPERSVVDECLQDGGTPRVYRDKAGKVVGVMCNRPMRWEL